MQATNGNVACFYFGEMRGIAKWQILKIVSERI